MAFPTEMNTLGRYAEAVVSMAEAAVVDQRMWLASDVDADLDIVAPRTLLLVNGASTKALLQLRVTASAAVKVDLYESPTYSLAGTGVTLYNADRNAGKTVKALLYHTPTVSADGTQIWGEITAGTIAGVVPHVGGTFILGAGKAYLLRTTSIADDTVCVVGISIIDDVTGAAAATTTTTTTSTTTTTTTT